jgi:hypothetical protein
VPRRTLYIDHSVVTHEALWLAIEDILSSGKLQLALSLWNLIEIGAATDKAQQERRLVFLEKFKPLWIRDAEKRSASRRAPIFAFKLKVSPEPRSARRSGSSSPPFRQLRRWLPHLSLS